MRVVQAHLDHFGDAFGIRTPAAGIAHTACIGFGLERLMLALFAAHGPAIESWPRDVLAALELGRA